MPSASKWGGIWTAAQVLLNDRPEATPPVVCNQETMLINQKIEPVF